MKTEVTIEGLDKLQARFKDPALIRAPLKDLLTTAAVIGRDSAKANISGGTEQAAYSIIYKVEPMEAQVYSMMPPARAMSIEQGRPPGEEPPWMQIARWSTGRRYLTSRTASGMTFQERREITLTQLAIKTAGAKAKKFIEKAGITVKSKMPALVADMARKVEARWNQSR